MRMYRVHLVTGEKFTTRQDDEWSQELVEMLRDFERETWYLLAPGDYLNMAHVVRIEPLS